MKCPRCGSENPPGTSFCGHCGIKLEPAPPASVSATKTLDLSPGDLARGRVFAHRYEIIEELGRGGMGRVFRVYDRKIDEEVALKVLNPEIAADLRTIDRFKNEIRSARRIIHKNVCRMHDLHEENGTFFVTMEYIAGEDLKSFIRRSRQLAPKTAVAIARQVCEGLIEAHRLGIIHRDLKPQNIMIDREGSARIMDFGIARSLGGRDRTEAGLIIGTPEYMSPEQAEGLEADERADIYSLGVIIFEMLTGRTPFKGETALGLIMKHKSEPPPDPAKLAPQVPAGLAGIVLKCLAKDRGQRYQSAGELLSALDEAEGALAGETPLAGEPAASQAPGAERLQKKGRLGPAVGLAAAAIVLIVAGYVLLSGVLRSREKGERPGQGGLWKNSVAVLPFRDLSPQKDKEHLCFGMTDAINDRLTQVGDLKVTATTSVMHYKDVNRDIKEIGRELGVAHILEGTVQVENHRIRVRAQLVSAETGFHVWSETYDRRLESIFDIQDEVSASIAQALRMRLSPEAIAAFKSDRPKDLLAYEFYLRGMNIIATRFIPTFQEEEFRSAVEMFKKTVELEPDNALAYAGLSWAYGHHLVVFGDTESLRLSSEYARRANEINPNLPLAMGMLALLEFRKDNFEGCFRFLNRAVSINPNISELNWLAGVLHRQAGLYDQAIRYFTRGRELDPFYPFFAGGLGMANMLSGRLEAAEDYFNKEVGLVPVFGVLQESYVLVLILRKEPAEAGEVLARWSARGGPSDRQKTARAYLFAANGEKDKALALSKDAYVYSLLGMKDQAIDSIQETMKDATSYPYLSLVNFQVFDSLRGDPRFEDIIKQKKEQYEYFLKLSGGSRP